MKLTAIILVFSPALVAQMMWFEPNQGQVHRSVQFLARTGHGYAYFGPDRMAVRDVRMQLVGANPGPQVRFEQPTGGITSYFIGRTEKDWHTGIPQYERVRYRNVYSGIDVEYYGSGRDVEYDFVVRPGADANQIRMAYNKPVRVDGNGDLLIDGLRQKRPGVYQNGQEIACDYLIGKNNEIRLALAQYDHSQTLTVDPVLEFSTYLGGVAEESGVAIALDASGFVYLAGGSQAPAAPDLNPFQQTTAQIASPVVFKMTPDGRHIVYYAYVGNNSWDHAYGVAVDASGSAIITGQTRNPNFPLKNAFQTTLKAQFDNAFFTKLSPDGKSLVYSSYLGGSHAEYPGVGLGLDSQGNAFIAGQTESTDFPTVNAFQPKYGGGTADCYLAKISPAGVPLWSTFFGGSGIDACDGVTVDAQGNPYIVGGGNSIDMPLKNAMQSDITPRNGFFTPLLAKFSSSGSLLASTFLGGPVAGAARAVATDLAGNVYVGGYTDAKLVTKNAFQSQTTAPISGFLMEIDNTLRNVIFATYLSGTTGDYVSGIALDTSGSIYVLGSATSADFPVKNSFQPFAGGGVCQCDIYVAKFPPEAQSLIYSTFMGGHDGDFAVGITVDPTGNAYVIGATRSQDFPSKNAFQTNFGGAEDFVFFKISDNTPLAPSPLVPNPGRLLFRYTQGGSSPVPQTVAVAGPAFTLATSAPWLSATTTGANVSVTVNPAGLAPNTYTGSVSLVPQGATAASIDVTLTVLAPAPALTSVDPAVVPMGSNDTTITVHGSGFTSSSVLQVNGIPWTVTPVQFVDSSTLKFSMPANYFSVLYNHTIAVQNPQSALSNVLSVAVGQPAPVAASVASAASYATGAVAPGEIVAVFGSNFGTQADTTVSFDNIPATIVYVTANQLAATVPYAVAGLKKTTMTISSKGVTSVPVSLNVTDSVPAIFTADASGKGQAAALNEDYNVNGPSNPAVVGSIVALYGTGGGALTNDSLPRLVLPVSATVGGLPATVYYAGIAPGLVQGAMQINVQIPSGVTPSSAVPVVIKIGDATSNTVMLAIQ